MEGVTMKHVEDAHITLRMLLLQQSTTKALISRKLPTTDIRFVEVIMQTMLVIVANVRLVHQRDK